MPLSGGTLTGMTTIKKSTASGDAIYWVETTNSNHRLGFGEGACGNRGMYDSALGWVFKIDTSNNVTISSSASTSSLTVNPSGNVLIGTTTDNGTGAKLQVNGAINVTTEYKIRGLDVLHRRTDHLSIGEETAVYASSPTHIYGTDVVLKYSTSKYIGFTLNSSGNGLIGTTTDNGYKLQVNGSERVYCDLIVDGEVSALVA